MKAFKSYLIPILFGVIFSRIIQFLFFPINVGKFSFDFGHISILSLVISSTLLLLGIKHIFLWISLGSSFDQLIYLIIKDNSTQTFFSAYSIFGSLIFIMLSVLLFLFIYKDIDQNDRNIPIDFFYKKNRIIIHCITTFLVILVFRISQILLIKAGIPNENRSFMILGYEIHHINHGLILIYITSNILYFFNFKRYNILILILLSIGIALINDQITYYALKNVSDEAYLGFESLIGAIGVSICQILILIIYTDVQKNNFS